ncbi:hypothetical protein RF11_11256 [Thelohanellus kitauei]|uniref:Uncharacterized protein n=1 Tax=Thelohanellus kitauei TaxID=669202 RepID=A0A0C2MHM4_THEKT|nr:hypothetical protein RF11_11256 [Thelohanellus kitauei]
MRKLFYQRRGMNNPDKISEDNVGSKRSVEDDDSLTKKQSGSLNGNENTSDEDEQTGPSPFDIIISGLHSDLSQLATTELPEIDNSIIMVPSPAESTPVIGPTTTIGIEETENNQKLNKLPDIDTFSTQNSSESSKKDNKFENVTPPDKDSKTGKRTAEKIHGQKANQSQCKSSLSGNGRDSEISQTKEKLIASVLNPVHQNHEENLEKKNRYSHQRNENPTNISTSIPENHPDTSSDNSHLANNFRDVYAKYNSNGS